MPVLPASLIWTEQSARGVHHDLCPLRCWRVVVGVLVRYFIVEVDFVDFGALGEWILKWGVLFHHSKKDGIEGWYEDGDEKKDRK